MSAEMLAAGVAVGFAVAAPIGPMGLLCLTRSLADGGRAGFAAGLGAATVHVAFGAVAVYALEAVHGLLAAAAGPMSLLAAAVLAWFAWSFLRRTGPEVPGAARATPRGWARSYGDALVLGTTNPLTIALFAAALPAVGAASDPASSPYIVLGIFLGSTAWWAILSFTAAGLRGRIKPAWLAATSRVAGLVLMMTALGLVLRTARLA